MRVLDSHLGDGCGVADHADCELAGGLPNPRVCQAVRLFLAGDPRALHQLMESVTSGPVSCARYGRGWRVEQGTRAAFVEHSVGMLHLAVLIANPGTEIAAVDLVAGLDAAAPITGRAVPQPILDSTAVRRYRQRLAELAGATDDTGERDWLEAELTANTRRGGRFRAFADNPERARLAAGRAIRRALTNVERAEPAIGAHLRASIHTGVRCWYRPI